MPDGTQNVRPDPPPITDEDLSNLEADPEFIDIPFVVSKVQLVKQLPGDERRLTQAEAGKLVEMLDWVTSSNKADPDLKDRCFDVLRQVSSTYRILPTSYHVAGVDLDKSRPHVSGGFADIWKVQLGDEELSVKGFRVQKTEHFDQVKQRFYREIIGWKRVSHPNVVPFRGVAEKSFLLCIINRSLPNGNILDYIRQNENVNRLELLAQTACGVKYLHSLNVVHGNINPGSIQIDGDGIACLGDFGIAAAITDLSGVISGTMTTSKSRSLRYTAPEQIKSRPLENSPTKASDVYSFSVTIYEVLTGILPYGNAQDPVLVLKIVQGDRPPRPRDAPLLRDEIWRMIEDCWSANREKRWNFDRVHEKLSVSSPGGITDEEREVGIAIPISSPSPVESPPHTPSPPRPSPTKTDVPPSTTPPISTRGPQEPDKLGPQSDGKRTRRWPRKLLDDLKRVVVGLKRKVRNKLSSNRR